MVLFSSRRSVRISELRATDVSPVSRIGVAGCIGGQVRGSCPPGANPPLHASPPRGTVGIRAVSLGAGSRALRQYSRAPRQETVSRPRALDGARRRSAIHVLDRPARHRDTRSCGLLAAFSSSLSLGFRVRTVIGQPNGAAVTSGRERITEVTFNSQLHVGRSPRGILFAPRKGSFV